jgi:hypothetical protein
MIDRLPPDLLCRFVAVAQTGNFFRACERVQLSQIHRRQQIRWLESYRTKGHRTALSYCADQMLGRSEYFGETCALKQKQMQDLSREVGFATPSA